jgi:D-inositol-3-phosphate glycosyltransferase
MIKMQQPAGAKRRTRVLIVSAYAAPHLGGVEVVVAQQAQTLASLGYQVTVLTTRCGGGKARERSDGYDVIRVPAWNILEDSKGIPMPLWSPAAIWRIARLVRKADVVHVHDVYHASSVLTALSARWLKRPLFVTQHVAIVSHDKTLVEFIQRLCYLIIAPPVWRRAISITVYNPIVEDFLMSHHVPARKIRLSYNGVDTAVFQPGTSSEIARTRIRHGIDPDTPVVLFAGRLVPKKGVHQLVRAASSRYQLVLAGPGRIPDDLPDGVTFLGPVSRSDLLALYQASDIFAYPATGEMLTLAMQEAMSCGLPVVTTNDDAYARYEFDPLGVAFIDPEPETLRATFIGILDDDIRRTYMRDYSRRLAQERFDWQKNAAGLAVEYDAACSGS